MRQRRLIGAALDSVATDHLPRTPALAGWGRLAGLFRFCREWAGVMIFFHQVRGPDGVRVVLSGEIDLSVREELRSVLAGVVAASQAPPTWTFTTSHSWTVPVSVSSSAPTPTHTGGAIR
jgi:hypothetical protein